MIDLDKLEGLDALAAYARRADGSRGVSREEASDEELDFLAFLRRGDNIISNVITELRATQTRAEDFRARLMARTAVYQVAHVALVEIAGSDPTIMFDGKRDEPVSERLAAVALHTIKGMP